MEKFLLKKLLVGTVFGFLLNSTTAVAGYGTDLHKFAALGTAWNPGTDSARSIGTPAPGGATWSIMGAGIASAPVDPHGGSGVTTAFTALLGQTQAEAAAYIDTIMNVWANASDFTNLGQVADGGSAFGAANAQDGHLGDIRVGAVFIDGAVGGNTLAHAFNPCTEGLCGGGGSVGGDTHVDNSNTWVDNAAANGGQLDLFTVLLHEFGHALGLGHSTVKGSVMEAIYAGARRDLHADDIAGIQAIYGAPIAVPLPGALFMFLSALSALGIFGRRRNSAISV